MRCRRQLQQAIVVFQQTRYILCHQNYPVSSSMPKSNGGSVSTVAFPPNSISPKVLGAGRVNIS
jgi:hypothetical protein